MKPRSKAKSARKHLTRKAHKAHRRPARASIRTTKGRHGRTRKTAPRATQAHYTAAIQGIQDAAASLSDGDVIDILSDLSWPTRAKWLSSYFADQLPEEAMDDGDVVADAVDDIGAQVAALLDALDEGRPTDFLSAVTCCFSADPSHVDAGLGWLQDNLGTQTIELDALEDLPGYQAVAEIVDRVRQDTRGG